MKNSIKIRYSIFSLAILLWTGVLIGEILLFRKILNIVKDNFREKIELILERAEYEFITDIEQFKNSYIPISLYPDNFLKNKNYKEYLKSIYEKNKKNIICVAYISSDGEKIEYIYPESSLPVTFDSTLHQEITNLSKTLKPLISCPFKLSKDTTVIAINFPLFSKNNKHIGSIAFFVSMQGLNKFFKKLSKNSKLLDILITKDGHLIFSSSTNSKVNECINLVTPTTDTFSIVSKNNKEIIFKKINLLDETYSIVAIYSKDTLFAPFITVRNLIYFIMLLSLLGFAMATIFFLKHEKRQTEIEFMEKEYALLEKNEKELYSIIKITSRLAHLSTIEKGLELVMSFLNKNTVNKGIFIIYRDKNERKIFKLPDTKSPSPYIVEKVLAAEREKNIILKDYLSIKVIPFKINDVSIFVAILYEKKFVLSTATEILFTQFSSFLSWQIEKELSKKEKILYKSFLKMIPENVMLTIIDEEENIILSSKGFRNLFHCNQEEKSISIKKDCKIFTDIFNDIKNSSLVDKINIEEKEINIDNFTHKLRIFSTKTSIKNKFYYTIIIHDITKIKASILAAKSFEKMYKLIFDHSSHLIFSVNTETEILDINPFAELHTGIKRGEKLQDYILDNLNLSLKEHNVLTKLIFYKDKKNNIYSGKISILPIPIHKTFLIIIEDTSSFYNTQKVITRLKFLKKALIDNSPSGIILSDNQGNIKTVNIALLKLFNKKEVRTLKDVNLDFLLERLTHTHIYYEGDFEYNKKIFHIISLIIPNEEFKQENYEILSYIYEKK